MIYYNIKLIKTQKMLTFERVVNSRHCMYWSSRNRFPNTKSTKRSRPYLHEMLAVMRKKRPE